MTNAENAQGATRPNALRQGSKHFLVLDYLRGIASLSVCFFHLACGNSSFLPKEDPIKLVAGYGWLGVYVFFVISGFIIPYSLHQRKDIGNSSMMSFLIRRLLRLEPPYLACILMILTLDWLSAHTPGFQGEPFKLELPRLIFHLGYMNTIVGYAWLNPVFWTLAIEFQFYLFVMLTYRFLSKSGWQFAATICAIQIVSVVGAEYNRFLMPFLPLFCIGISVYAFICKQIDRNWLAACLAISVATCVYTLNALEAFAGLATAIVILWARDIRAYRGLHWLRLVGIISYSLYLVHIPVGGRFINLSMRFSEAAAARYVFLAGALAVSIAAATLMYLAIERPSLKLAKRFGKKSSSQTETVSAAGHS